MILESTHKTIYTHEYTHIHIHICIYTHKHTQRELTPSQDHRRGASSKRSFLSLGDDPIRETPPDTGQEADLRRAGSHDFGEEAEELKRGRRNTDTRRGNSITNSY